MLPSLSPSRQRRPEPGPGVLLAFCCGAIVANIYYAQPIVGLIAPDLGLSTEHASLIVSLTQLGYAWACCCWCRWPTCWKTAA
jgi:predicted MFS family arabinose efflux permease